MVEWLGNDTSSLTTLAEIHQQSKTRAAIEPFRSRTATCVEEPQTMCKRRSSGGGGFRRRWFSCAADGAQRTRSSQENRHSDRRRPSQSQIARRGERCRCALGRVYG